VVAAAQAAAADRDQAEWAAPQQQGSADFVSALAVKNE